jgi:hypothetical protein
MPLEHMLSIINKPDMPLTKKSSEEEKTKARELTQRKDDMARAAAPYVHARLAAIEINGGIKHEIKHSLDLTKLSDEELLVLERIFSKAQVNADLLDLDAVELDPNDPQLLTYDPSDNTVNGVKVEPKSRD